MATKMLKEIIKGSERKFGRAIILIAFAIISLISAFILFKSQISSGIMTIVFPQNQGKADLGGAIVGFLLILWLLISKLDNEDDKELTLKGNVLDAKGKPIKGAIVFVVGIDRRKETDDTGFFAIEVKTQNEWNVQAAWQEQSTAKMVKNNELNSPIILKFAEETQKKTP